MRLHKHDPMNDTFVLKKVNIEDIELGNDFSFDKNVLMRVAFFDTETTGLSPVKDSVIEIGIRIGYATKEGEFLGLSNHPESKISQLHDPGCELTETITRITGITNEMLKGKSFDLEKIRNTLSVCDVIVAHNAGFDRPFIEKICQTKALWACSQTQISWEEEHGFGKCSLEYLAMAHGMFYDGHRALNDVEVLACILKETSDITGKQYFQHMYEAAKQPVYKISAIGFPFNTKDALKEIGMRWDGDKKVWFIFRPEESLNLFLEKIKTISSMEPFVQKIDAEDRFKL